MENAGEIPLILGHPFLAMTHTNINIANGTMTLIVEGKEVMFDLHEIVQALVVVDDQMPCKVDTIDQYVQEVQNLTLVHAIDEDSYTKEDFV